MKKELELLRTDLNDPKKARKILSMVSEFDLVVALLESALPFVSDPLLAFDIRDVLKTLGKLK